MFAASKTASVSAAYQISRSLRFNSADSTTLNRTFATNGTSRTTATISFWTKLAKLELGEKRIIDSYDGSSSDSSGIYYENNKFTIKFGGSGVGTQLITTPVYRDPSAWYHICAVFDSTQATSTDRIKFYVNGVQVTSFSSATYPNQNATFVYMSSGVRNYIGDAWNAPTSYLVNLYLTELFYIDGQALTPSSFGETNAQTGVWQPKAYSGSYGTNGFYLNFSDNSNTTAATLGKDYSGNGNNWTPNNFSVTAGAGNDSLVDSPTSYGTDTGAGGTVRGNYCTWNPLNNPQSAVLTNGNLDLSTAGVTARYGTYTTIGVSSAKWYWEITAGSLSTDGYEIGIASASKSATAALGADTNSYIYLVNGDKRTNATTVAYGATYTAGDVIGIALDLDAGTLVFYKNGTSQGTAYTSIPSNTWFPTVADDNTGSTTGSSFIANFGQRPFAYTAPSGFKALCTQNLPTPTIGATTATLAGKYFNPVTYTGTGTTNSITGVGFQPDWTWIKSRSNGAYHHRLTDVVRGVTKEIYSNLTNAEGTDSNGLTAFGSDGFTVGSSNEYNASATTFVAWNWKANGTGVTNTSGSITSTVSANTTSGFSIVTYTGNGTNNATVGHGLGATPSMIIIKQRNAARDWPVYHVGYASAGVNDQAYLNLTNAAVGGIADIKSVGSSTFALDTWVGVNGSGNTYVAYCFTPVVGYSAFGSYTGNGSSDGPFIYTGFRPRYVMIKDTQNTWPWVVVDTARNTYNVMNAYLEPNTSDAEATNFAQSSIIDVTANGFKTRTSDAYTNTNGSRFIFAAFAEFPFKYSLAR